MELDKKMCPVLEVDGFIEKGKQFDIDITVPEDNRNVVYGQLKDCYGEPVKDAVIKLIEVCGNDRKPVSHTFTNKYGEFVFGPLCPDKSYEVQIWKNAVKHFKVCADCKCDGNCLKGVELGPCNFPSCKPVEPECCPDKCCKK